jgi:hypothetical protein
MMNSDFLKQILTACKYFGFPVFLKTGHFSGKHSWKNTCFLQSPDDIIKHVIELADQSLMCGLPYHVWAVREMLPTTKFFVADRYCDLPITKEIRGFIKDGKIQCIHPYWPDEAIKKGMSRIPASFDLVYGTMCELSSTDEKQINIILETLASSFNGYWSADLLKAADGKWYLIDMAEGERSFHWLECSHCMTTAEII